MEYGAYKKEYIGLIHILPVYFRALWAANSLGHFFCRTGQHNIPQMNGTVHRAGAGMHIRALIIAWVAEMHKCK